MNNLIALVIGATGATGKKIVSSLLADNSFAQVKIFVRRATGLNHPKLSELIVDFDRIADWKDALRGDVLFSALGTTLKQAGSKARQRQIDFTYQFETAQAAAQNGVETFVLVSSTGADPKSVFFYPRIKGELEESVKQLSFKSIYIFQPGILERGGDDARPLENLALTAIKSLNSLGLFKSQKPLPVGILAEKMIKVSKLPTPQKTVYYRLGEIFDL